MSKMSEVYNEREVMLQVHDSAVEARSQIIRQYIEHVTALVNSGYVDFMAVNPSITALFTACGESSRRAFEKRDEISATAWRAKNVPLI